MTKKVFISIERFLFGNPSKFLNAQFKENIISHITQETIVTDAFQKVK